MNHRHPIFTTIQHVCEIIRPLNKLGISYFTYTRSEDDGSRIYLSSHANIMENYFSKKLYLNGNTEAKPSKYHSQIIFWDTLLNQNIFKFSRSQNVDYGIYIIKAHNTYCEFFGFATKKGNVNIINTYLNQLDTLKKFIDYFLEKAQFLVKQVEEQKIILPFRKLIAKNNQLLHQAAFSKRQSECVDLLLSGKTTKEIANHLQLSPRTIEHYINTIKNKFGCKNKTELAVKLMKIY